MKQYLCIYCVLCYLCVLRVRGDHPLVEIKSEESSQHEGAIINGTYYETVKSYYCRTSKPNVYQEVLVYGSRAWSFPQQDVNLTLQYPPRDSQIDENIDYSITELRVVLYMEGAHSRGYITQGGLLQNNVIMTFIMKSLMRLTYEFWLYGVPAPPPAEPDIYNTAEAQLRC